MCSISLVREQRSRVTLGAVWFKPLEIEWLLDPQFTDPKDAPRCSTVYERAKDTFNKAAVLPLLQPFVWAHQRKENVCRSVRWPVKEAGKDDCEEEENVT